MLRPPEKLYAEPSAVDALNGKAAEAAAKLGPDPAQADPALIRAAEAAHERVVQALQDIVNSAKFREDNALNDRKVPSADLDATKAGSTSPCAIICSDDERRRAGPGRRG